jgi:hypothetical protein
LKAKTVRQFVGTLALRSWLVFSALAVLGFVVFLFLDGDNPLQSDDPYLVGFFFGTVAACFAILFTVMESIAQRVRRITVRDLVYSVVLAGWCLLLLAGSRGGGEGEGILVFSASASFVSGLLTYPLCRYNPPRVVVIVVSCMGVLLFAMYGVVCVRMAQRF